MARIFSALALAFPFLLFVWYAPPLAFLWLAVAFAARLGWEFQRLAAACGWRGRLWDVALDAPCLLLAIWVGGPLPGVVLTFVTFRFLVRSLAEEKPREGVARAAVLLLGVIWFGGAGALIVLTRAFPEGREALVFLAVTVWLNDIAAYLVGRNMGRRKLAPVISPNKTVEGAFGGLVAAGLAGAFLGHWMPALGLNVAAAAAVAAVLGGFAQFGDLCESMLKRAAGEKDSADLIPGHGGLFDRIDGLLLAGPPFYYFLTWLHAF